MKQDLYEKLVAYIIDNQNKFYRLSFSYLKNQEDALDAVQNAVCKALERYEDLRNEEAMKAWFYRIVLNESYAILNARKRMIPTEDSGYWESTYEEEGFEPYDDLYERLDQLEEEVQTIIKLRYFEELALKEIAHILKMNLSTVKAKLYRGLKALRIIVEEEARA